MRLPVTNFSGDVNSDGAILEGCNLEGESPANLAEFAKLCSDPLVHRNLATQLFPYRDISKACKATMLYGVFSQIKSAAFILRAQGWIHIASSLEEQCDKIYNELPDFARW